MSTVRMAWPGINHESAMRVSDADRNGTQRRLHNAVALGLIDIDEFEERSGAGVAGPPALRPRRPSSTTCPDPAPSSPPRTDRVELRGVLGSLKRHGEWVRVPDPAGPAAGGWARVDLDLTQAPASPGRSSSSSST